ncbi:MAG: hypothetical protein JXQ83_00875 [Candidatus Glassbacteria bacterium]|nr:hypothetical protein [Candidatus Glassbacteria bacterium]
MADSTLSLLKKVCKYHRSKQYYVANQAGEAYLPGGSPEQDCWCLLTQGPVGPDDKFVSARECGPGRECFKSQLA